jgi:hypothetical protein
MSIEALRAALPNLTFSDASFAQSLIDQSARRPLSDKQWAWVKRLTERANAPARQTASLGSVAGLLDLFATAKANGLKNPAIVAQSPVGAIRLSVAGERARQPGTINVAEKGRFGEATWYGRIKLDGTFEAARDGAPAELVAYLAQFAANPAETAAAHGHTTGNCCFCDRPLTDARSTAVGYGPVCAKKWALPWGEKPAAAPVKSYTDVCLSLGRHDLLEA